MVLCLPFLVELEFGKLEYLKYTSQGTNLNPRVLSDTHPCGARESVGEDPGNELVMEHVRDPTTNSATHP